MGGHFHTTLERSMEPSPLQHTCLEVYQRFGKLGRISVLASVWRQILMMIMVVIFCVSFESHLSSIGRRNTEEQRKKKKYKKEEEKDEGGGEKIRRIGCVAIEKRKKG